MTIFFLEMYKLNQMRIFVGKLLRFMIRQITTPTFYMLHTPKRGVNVRNSFTANLNINKLIFFFLER